MSADTCTRCGREITDAESALCWPVRMGDGEVCPDCYGDEAFCGCGATLHGADGSSRCAACETRRVRDDLLAALSDHNHGDGCLGVIVDQAIADGITDVETIRAICEDAEDDSQ